MAGGAAVASSTRRLPRWTPSLQEWQRTLRERRVRIVVAALGALMLLTAGVNGLWALGLPLAASVPLTLASGAAAAWAAAARLPAGLEEIARRRRVAAILWLVLAAGAILQTGRLGSYMYDVGRPQHSILPRNEFLVAHSCLTAYTEAARLAREGGTNIYGPNTSAATIGPLRVDRYLYPPAFLLVPGAYEVLTGDFFRTRAAWFATQTLTLAVALVASARWIGGATGMRAGLLAPVVLVAPTTLLTLQIGNHQLTVYALAILGMLGFARRHVLLGAALLAFAVTTKIFPGLLLVYLLVRRQWHAAGWTVAFALGFTLASLMAFGSRPYVDFLQDQLPRLASGEAFPVIDLPFVAAQNHSIYGLMTKLRQLDLTSAGPSTAHAITWLYTAGLLLLTVAIARRHARCDAEEPDRRAVALITWLALLSLAAFRSPFTPDVYAFLGTVWMLTLFAARARTPRALGLWLLGIVPFLWTASGIAGGDPPAWLLLAGTGTQLAAISLSVWGVVQHPRSSRFAATTTMRNPEPAC
jgi:alpha-1,2-mannosyltransferase